jgi:predicted nucleotidyltransferase
MDPRLLHALDLLLDHFRPDPRCLGISLHGSIGRGETDAYSDVDVTVVVSDESYEALRDELRPLCERICGPIAVWLAEGERHHFCNYAFLYEAGDDLLLWDLEIAAAGLFEQERIRPDRVLYDPTGLLGRATSQPAPAAAVTPGRLQQLIDHFWVYAYLDGKYARRNALYKLLYVQQVLFQAHLKALLICHLGTEGSWWADDIGRLPAERRDELTVYFGASTIDGLRGALTRELEMFGRDARAACEKLGVTYPDALESVVRKHLKAMGALDGPERGCRAGPAE